MTEESQDSPKPEKSEEILTPEQKLAIRDYMSTAVVLPSTLAAILSAILGYLINDNIKKTADIELAEQVQVVQKRISELDEQIEKSKKKSVEQQNELHQILRSAKELKGKAGEIADLLKNIQYANSNMKIKEHTMNALELLNAKPDKAKLLALLNDFKESSKVEEGEQTVEPHTPVEIDFSKKPKRSVWSLVCCTGDNMRMGMVFRDSDGKIFYLPVTIDKGANLSVRSNDDLKKPEISIQHNIQGKKQVISYSLRRVFPKLANTREQEANEE